MNYLLFSSKNLLIYRIIDDKNCKHFFSFYVTYMRLVLKIVWHLNKLLLFSELLNNDYILICNKYLPLLLIVFFMN